MHVCKGPPVSPLPSSIPCYRAWQRSSERIITNVIHLPSEFAFCSCWLLPLISQYLLESDGEILLPPALKSSRLSLSNFHVYLLDNSQELLLWIGGFLEMSFFFLTPEGRDVSQEWANDVFGKQSLGQLQSFNLSPLESPKTDAGIRLNNLVSALRLRRSRSLRVSYFLYFQHHHVSHLWSSLYFNNATPMKTITLGSSCMTMKFRVTPLIRASWM